MRTRRILLTVLLPIASLFSLILPPSAAMDLPDHSSINHPTIAPNMSQESAAPMVAYGHHVTVGLKSDGTVIAVGDCSWERCDTSDWTDIVQVAAGDYHTVGLKSDGTVVAAGRSGYGECNLGGWTDIVQVAAGFQHTMGLKSDGTVVAKGYCSFGQCDVGSWTDIVQVAAGGLYTVGVKSDRTVIAAGWNEFGQCDVGSWTDIIQVAAGSTHTVGLKSDGTVVAVGENTYGRLNVGNWTDIVQVAAGDSHTVGLKSNGTVVAVGENTYGRLNVGNWTDIVQVAAGDSHTVGIKSDGTVVATIFNAELSKWNLGITTAHTLTITSTDGGTVVTPTEESLNYTAGAMVRLVAEPAADYRFANWTGSVGAIFNINAATTIITMTDNYSIRANFEENPPTNWLLIGGIIAAVVAVGLGIFFVRRRRAA